MKPIGTYDHLPERNFDDERLVEAIDIEIARVIAVNEGNDSNGSTGRLRRDRAVAVSRLEAPAQLEALRERMRELREREAAQDAVLAEHRARLEAIDAELAAARNEREAAQVTVGEAVADGKAVAGLDRAVRAADDRIARLVAGRAAIERRAPAVDGSIQSGIEAVRHEARSLLELDRQRRVRAAAHGALTALRENLDDLNDRREAAGLLAGAAGFED
ncbi:MAG: hypothetical protein AB7P21_07670 [Lautropia sp.]